MTISKIIKNHFDKFSKEFHDNGYDTTRDFCNSIQKKLCILKTAYNFMAILRIDSQSFMNN